MSATAQPSARIQDRHSHIGIRLQYRNADKWEHIQALDWNAQGFSFHCPQPIDTPALAFKRGLTHFDGHLVWHRVSSDDNVLREALVNELIFKRASGVVSDPVRQGRLLRLIRVPDMVEQKRQVLASLGLDISDERLEALMTARKQERPLVQYGVRVDSPAWTAVVASALSMSEAVTSLEQWSRALRG